MIILIGDSSAAYFLNSLCNFFSKVLSERSQIQRYPVYNHANPNPENIRLNLLKIYQTDFLIIKIVADLFFLDQLIDRSTNRFSSGNNTTSWQHKPKSRCDFIWKKE